MYETTSNTKGLNLCETEGKKDTPMLLEGTLNSMSEGTRTVTQQSKQRFYKK